MLLLTFLVSGLLSGHLLLNLAVKLLRLQTCLHLRHVLVSVMLLLVVSLRCHCLELGLLVLSALRGLLLAVELVLG